jgi:hypothetical protein
MAKAQDRRAKGDDAYGHQRKQGLNYSDLHTCAARFEEHLKRLLESQLF